MFFRSSKSETEPKPEVKGGAKAPAHLVRPRDADQLPKEQVEATAEPIPACRARQAGQAVLDLRHNRLTEQDVRPGELLPFRSRFPKGDCVST